MLDFASTGNEDRVDVEGLVQLARNLAKPHEVRVVRMYALLLWVFIVDQ